VSTELAVAGHLNVNDRDGSKRDSRVSNEALIMVPFKPIVLCVDTKTSELVRLRVLLRGQQYNTLTATNESEAFELFSDHFVGAVIIGEPKEEAYASSLVLHMKQAKPHVPIMLVSCYTRMSENALNSIDAFVYGWQPEQALLANLDRILNLNTSFFSRWLDNWRTRLASIHIAHREKEVA
jgi:response regulator RpfG family c-di-GMP phosphodiesterase